MRDENDEPIYIKVDPFMRKLWEIRQSIKISRCSALNQYYKSTTSDEVFNFYSEEIVGNLWEILDKQIECTIKQRKTIEDEFDSLFRDYRDNDEEERTKHINKELDKLSTHTNLQKLNLNDVLMKFDATSLYPSATWDEKSVYPKIERGFAFKLHMNDVYVKSFNDQIFNQDGDESAK